MGDESSFLYEEATTLRKISRAIYFAHLKRCETMGGVLNPSLEHLIRLAHGRSKSKDM
jgi:hypothetical protein